MNKEKDFFKTCFNTVLGLEVKNESQAIAKEVVLSEIEHLQQENKKLNDAIQTYDILLKSNVEDNKRLTQKIKKALEKIEEYNLGKYDYSIPTIGIIELKEILEGKSKWI